jgi:hypothetical protein
MINVELDYSRKVLTFRATGVVTVAELQRTLVQVKTVLAPLRGAEHIVLADVRGLAPMSPEASELFGAVIRYGREHGTALCVHLSDSSIAKLQTARLAREASPQDQITVNVVSLKEAEKVINERYPGLRAASGK